MLTQFVVAAGPDVLLAWVMRLALLGLLVLVCAADLRVRRIPNRAVVAGLLVAIAWHGVAPAGDGLFDHDFPGGLGLAASLAGAAAAFTGFLVLYLAGTMGAGDVKLVTMLGAFFGLSMLPALVLAVFATGGVLVALRLFDGARRRAVFANLRIILFGRLATLAGGVGPRFDPRTDSADRLPFALAISGGALVTAIVQWSGGAS